MSEIRRYRAAVGGDKTVWPIVVPDERGQLVHHRDHLKAIARLSAPITADDLNATWLKYGAGDKQAYAEAFNAIIEERAKGIK